MPQGRSQSLDSSRSLGVRFGGHGGGGSRDWSQRAAAGADWREGVSCWWEGFPGPGRLEGDRGGKDIGRLAGVGGSRRQRDGLGWEDED